MVSPYIANSRRNHVLFKMINRWSDPNVPVKIKKPRQGLPSARSWQGSAACASPSWMSHLDNQKRQFTSRFYSNDITSFSNNDPRPVPSRPLSQQRWHKTLMGRGVEEPWSSQSWADSTKNVRIRVPAPRKCLSLRPLPGPGQWIFWADNIPQTFIIFPNNWWCGCHVPGGFLSQNMSQHLTTEMSANRNLGRYSRDLSFSACRVGWHYIACFVAGPGDSAQGGLGVTSGWECLITPLCVVSAVTAAGSANSGAKKEASYIVINIPISIPLKPCRK